MGKNAVSLSWDPYLHHAFFGKLFFSPVQDQTTYENTKITSKIVSRYISRKKGKQIEH